MSLGALFIVIIAIILFLSYRYTNFPAFLRYWTGAGIGAGVNFSVVYLFWSVLIGALISLIVLLSIWIADPIFSGIAFLLAVFYVYAVSFLPNFIVWLIVNTLHAFGIDIPERPYIFPASIKMFAAWIAFFGLLAVIHPGLMTFKLLLIVSLVSFIFFAFVGRRKKASEPILIPLTIILLAIAGWKWAMPDNFRASTRHLSARGSQVNTGMDRSSLVTEGNAAVTYARLNRDVMVLYQARLSEDEDNNIIISSLSDVPVRLSADTLVKVFNHKDETLIFEGQGFVEIQLPKRTGSFVGGEKYWIEADYLDLVTPTERRLADQKREEIIIQPVSNTPVIRSSQHKVSGYYKNSGHYLLASAGGETDMITVAGCRSYYFDNDGAKITLYYPDGTHANSWEIAKWPDKASFRLKNWSDKDISLIII